MDNDDREEIEERLKIIETNNHNVIEQYNKQIKINTQFDDQLTKHTNLHNEQSKTLVEQLKSITDIKNTVDSQTRLESLKYQIDHLSKIIEKTRELILMSKLHTLNRDILTDDEISDYNITMDKMENIETNLATFETNIVFIIKIPIYNKNLYKSIYIQPIPNKSNKQIIIKQTTNI